MSSRAADPLDALCQVIEARREELVALTRDLVRFPTVNPPGEAYQPCAEFIGERLARRGFALEYVRATGAPGDSDRYPRINVIARRESGTRGPCVHFNGHIDVVRTGGGWTVGPFAGLVHDGKVFGRGACDMRHMNAVLERFETQLLPKLAARKTDMPVVPSGARHSTLNLNSIHGGLAELEGDALPAPCVADSCRLVIDRRWLVEESLDSVKGEVREILERLVQERPGFRYSLRDLFVVQPTLADLDGPVARSTAAAVRRVLGRPAEFVCSPGTYDQKHIDRIGKLRDCVAYGPGILEIAHRPDEYVVIDDLVASAKVMALAARALLQRNA